MPSLESRRKSSQEQIDRDANNVAFGDLYESLDQESQLELEIELGFVLEHSRVGSHFESSSEQSFEPILKILTRKSSLTEAEIRNHIGGNGCKPLPSEHIPLVPELDQWPEIEGAEHLESILDSLTEALGLTQADMLPNHRGARSPLVNERHRPVSFAPLSSRSWEPESLLLPVMKFDTNTGELFIWGERRRAQVDHLSRRLIFFEDKEMNIKEGLELKYFPINQGDGGEPLPLSVNLSQSVRFPEYSLDKTVYQLFDWRSGWKRKTEFDIKIEKQTNVERILRHYAISLDHEKHSSKKSFRFQRFNVEENSEDKMPAEEDVDMIMFQVKRLYKEKYPLLPIDDISVERDEESIRLRIERREASEGRDPFIQVDKAFLRAQ